MIVDMQVKQTQQFISLELARLNMIDKGGVSLDDLQYTEAQTINTMLVMLVKLWEAMGGRRKNFNEMVKRLKTFKEFEVEGVEDLKALLDLTIMIDHPSDLDEAWEEFPALATIFLWGELELARYALREQKHVIEINQRVQGVYLLEKAAERLYNERDNKGAARELQRFWEETRLYTGSSMVGRLRTFARQYKE